LLRSSLPFDHYANVHLVELNKLSMTFAIGLDRFVFFYRTGNTESEIAGEGEAFSSVGFVLSDDAPGDGYIDLKQSVHRLRQPGQFEDIQPHAALWCQINNLMGSGFHFHQLSPSINES
jgi:hypothetical protein